MKIKYRLSNGKTIEVEVTAEQAEVLIAVQRTAKSNDRKFEKRRAKEASLSYLQSEFGWEPTDESAGIEETLEREERERQDIIRAEMEKRLPDLIAMLTEKQQALVRLHFFENMSLRQIATIYGTDHKNIGKQLQTIYKKLKTFF